MLQHMLRLGILHAKEGVGTADLVLSCGGRRRARSEDRGSEGWDRTAGSRVGGDGNYRGGDGAVGRDVSGRHDLGRGAGRRSEPPKGGDTDGEGVGSLL